MMPALRPCSLKVLLATVALACGGGGDGGGGIVNPPPPGTPSATATVTLGAASFLPTGVSVTRNGTVTWNNTSSVTHNVTFAAATGAPQNIGDHSSGSNSRTFNTAGTFNYSCTLHGGMAGSVTVQ